MKNKISYKQLAKNETKKRTKDARNFQSTFRNHKQSSHVGKVNKKTINWKKLEEKLSEKYAEKMGVPVKRYD